MRCTGSHVHFFTTFELSSGADGARSFADSHNAIRCGAGNSGGVPVEADELTNPLLFEALEIAPDTFGAGRFPWRGSMQACVTADQGFSLFVSYRQTWLGFSFG